MITEEYAPGRRLDLHGDDGPVVLLWHGRGADSRAAVAGLAAAIAEHGRRVVVPDWDSATEDGGRSALRASLTYARGLAARTDADPDELVVVGWSLGGTAAVGLVTGAESAATPVSRIVLLSPGDGPRALDPFSGRPLPATFPDGTGRTPIDVVSAIHDDIATPELVRGLADRLGAAGWPTTWTAVDADHGTIAMTRLDEVADRFVPVDDEAARAAGARVAAIVAGATCSS
jgi:dienelactone hydrolase